MKVVNEKGSLVVSTTFDPTKPQSTTPITIITTKYRYARKILLQP
eukprot:SAG22_NODE_12220_length_451_cov_8.562500_1_plen_44_part_10